MTYSLTVKFLGEADTGQRVFLRDRPDEGRLAIAWSNAEQYLRFARVQHLHVVVTIKRDGRVLFRAEVRPPKD